MMSDVTQGHTPLPWAAMTGEKSRGRIMSVCKGFIQVPVAQALGINSIAEREANAALIVAAVNSYPQRTQQDALINELVGALEKIYPYAKRLSWSKPGDDYYGDLEIARNALAAAKEAQS